MIEVVSNLLGEIIEFYEWDRYGNDQGGYRMRGRGHVRAIYVADKTLMVLVEHDLGFDSVTYSDRSKDGGFEAYALNQGRARVVERCGRCYAWDQKTGLVHIQTGDAGAWIWTHKDGEGCKKVGHGG